MTEKTCLRCQSANLEPGRLMRPMSFKPDTAKFFSLGKVILASACQDCGHIDLSVSLRRGEKL